MRKNMRKLIYFLTIISGFLCACNSKNTSTSILHQNPGILERLKYEKNEIDTLFKKGEGVCLTFVKVTETGQPLLLETDTIPEETITTYYILKDSLGKVITISELPTSVSGDWFIVMTHYFDKDGKTFAFERQTNFFNSGCVEGIVYETITEFYNSDFQMVDKTYNLVDEKNKPLKIDSCTFPYDYEYKVLVDVEEYLRAIKIKP
jgi:hypothetical protein